MRVFLQVLLLAFSTSLFSGTAWSQTEAALIPRQAIFAEPDKEQVMLYLTDNRARDKAALYAIELATGKATLLVEDPLTDDLPALLVHVKTGRVQTASSYYGRLRRHFLDPSILPDFEYLRTVQRGDIGGPSPIGGRSLDDRFWLTVFMDGGPARYYLYDRTARRAYEPCGNDLRGSSLEVRAGGELIPELLLVLNQKPSAPPK